MKDNIKEALDEIAQAKPRLQNAIDNQIKVWNQEIVDSQPLLLQCPLSNDERDKFPTHTFKDVHYDSQKNMEAYIPQMLMSLRGGAQSVPSARANMGCGIYAAWLGLVQTLYDDKMP